MKTDKAGDLWMRTGDEAIMDEEGYIQSEWARSAGTKSAI
jgi:hypothetical protein